MAFDLRINEIQHCPVKKDMRWFSQYPEMEIGMYMTEKGPYTYHDDHLDIIGICKEIVYNKEGIESYKILPFQTHRIIQVSY